MITFGITFDFYRETKCMARDTNLEFITDKLYQLRNAVMYSMSNSLVRLPNDIVTLVKVDEEGNLWFVSRQPKQLTDECEQVFPAKLCFYKKGVDYFVEVSGKAMVVNNNYTQATSDNREKEDIKLQYRPVLIKMSMANIEYTEPHADATPSKVESWFRNAYKWCLYHVAIPRHAGAVLSKLQKSNWHG
jgi:general stress protein 26